MPDTSDPKSPYAGWTAESVLDKAWTAIVAAESRLPPDCLTALVRIALAKRSRDEAEVAALHKKYKHVLSRKSKIQAKVAEQLERCLQAPQSVQAEDGGVSARTFIAAHRGTIPQWHEEEYVEMTILVEECYSQKVRELHALGISDDELAAPKGIPDEPWMSGGRYLLQAAGSRIGTIDRPSRDTLAVGAEQRAAQCRDQADALRQARTYLADLDAYKRAKLEERANRANKPRLGPGGIPEGEAADSKGEQYALGRGKEGGFRRRWVYEAKRY
ncbi:hypothetical protein JCM3770_006105 [Rhodotorula araucariae]